MMRTLRFHFVALALLCCGCAWGAAASTPEVRPFRAVYEVFYLKLLLGRVEVTLEADADGAYRYGSVTTTAGALKVFRGDVITETSVGRIEGGRVIPLEYEYTHKSSDRDRRVQVKFDWTEGSVVNYAKDSHWRMDIPPGTQDKASQQLALMLTLSAQDPAAAFEVADGGRLKRYRYKSVETLSLDTLAGEQRIFRVARSKGDRPSRTSIWLAPELHNLPVKAEKEEDGRILTMRLQELEWTGAVIPLPAAAEAPRASDISPPP